MAAMTGKLSRRRFVAGTAAGLAAPSLIPSRAMGTADRRPPSDRVVAALVGCGGRGMALLGIHDDPGCTLAAVCDVDLEHLAAAKSRIGRCDAFQDFRRILDRKDIDAVLIGYGTFCFSTFVHLVVELNIGFTPSTNDNVA